jgi:membrane-associated phospholipid phosphatase
MRPDDSPWPILLIAAQWSAKDLQVFKIVPRDASDDLQALRPVAGSWGTATHVCAVGVVLAVLSAAALSIDLNLAQFVRQHALPGELRRLVRLSEVFAWGGTVALIIAIAAVLDSRRWRVVLPLAVPAFGAGLMADGIKLCIARMRPIAATQIETVQATFIGWLPSLHRDASQPHGHAIESFPSAHSATAVGLAIALSALYPRGRWLFALFALLAMAQRIEAQAHYLSDVFAGAALGCLVGAACVRLQPGGCGTADLEVN